MLGGDVVGADPSRSSDARTPGAPDRVAHNSISVAVWTVVGRSTGFLRVAVVAAVLGPTFFGNTYQSVNQIPNLAYELLAGNLIVSLLVPPLVRHLDASSPGEAQRLARGFLGVVVVAFAGVAMLLVLLGPLLLGLLTLGVDDPSIRSAQLRTGLVLLVFVAPQLVLYGVAGTGMAVQQACGHYGFSTAAYSFENLTVVAVVVAYGLAFGTGTDVETVGMLPVVVLGAGSTVGVVALAAAQWWGAHRAGVPLGLRWGWRDPQVREVMTLARASVAFAGLNAMRLFGNLIAAGSVPGGVIAFQVAMGLFNLPVAIGGRPVAWALVPRLTRLAEAGATPRFLGQWSRGVTVSVFLVAPVAVVYAVLAGPIADVVGQGEMRGGGADLIAAALVGLALGIPGETAFIHGTHASYSRRDARNPLRSMALRVAVTYCGLVVAVVATSGVATLTVVGLSVGLADLLSASYLGHRIRRALGATSRLMLPSLLRTLTASLCMAVVVVAVARLVIDMGDVAQPALLGIAVCSLVGLAGYVATHAALRSPELVPVQSRLSKWWARA